MKFWRRKEDGWERNVEGMRGTFGMEKIQPGREIRKKVGIRAKTERMQTTAFGR